MEKKYLYNTYSFLNGGGEMGELTRSFNWSATSIGSPDNWPQSLRTIVSVVLSSKFPMFLWWGEELIQFYNDAYRPSLGNGNKHPLALGQKGKDCWPEIWNIISPLIQQVRCTGEATWSEDQLIPIYRNGKLEDVYWTFGYSPVIGEDGSIEGVLVVCHETTPKIKLLNRLTESEQNMRMMILQAPVAICTFKGPEHLIQIVNPLMQQMLNGTALELEGKSFFETMPGTSLKKKEKILESILNGNSFVAEEEEFILPTNDKPEITCLSYIYEPIKNSIGNIEGIMVFAIDVTKSVKSRKKEKRLQQQLTFQVKERTGELHLANSELAQANQNLQKSNSKLEQFAYIASHDLQEPIRKISTFVKMLEDSIGDSINERAKNYIDRIHNSTDRMTNLIQDILGFSQLSKENDGFEPINLTDTVTAILTDFDLIIEQKKATITYNGLPIIDAIPIQMAQLFGNLISNSLKYSREDINPVITISTTLLSEEEKAQDNLYDFQTTYYKIELSDNGIGFNQEYAQQIFNIFQRLHSKADYAGTGIGLAMCKKIAQNHNGNIYALAGEKEGATFVVILPQKQQTS